MHKAILIPLIILGITLMCAVYFIGFLVALEISIRLLKIMPVIHNASSPTLWITLIVAAIGVIVTQAIIAFK